jgi:hypothetical protein
VTVVRAIDTRRRAACPDEPDTPAEQETSITKKTSVGILAQLGVSGCGRPPRKPGNRWRFRDHQGKTGKQDEADNTDDDHVA